MKRAFYAPQDATASELVELAAEQIGPEFAAVFRSAAGRTDGSFTAVKMVGENMGLVFVPTRRRTP